MTSTATGDCGCRMPLAVVRKIVFGIDAGLGFAELSDMIVRKGD
jgi:hypothetical protein